MDQRDEFSKWMSAVEEALSIEGKELAEDVPAINECGCGNWDCPICFPEQGEMQAADGHNPETTVVIGGVDIGEPGSPEFGHNDKEHEHGKEFAAGIDSGRNDIESDEFSGFEEASMFDEEEMDFEQAEEPRSGKGVKLGDIVTKTEFRKTGGVDSPMTYGEDNLDEEPAGMEVSQPLYGEEDPNVDDAMEMISSIKYMQDMGLSKASQSYDENRLASMNIDQLRKFHDEVMGGVTSTTSQGGQTFTTPTGTTHTNAVKADMGMEEETDPTKPAKTKFKSAYDPMDDLDDILNPRPDQPLATMGGSDDDENELASDEPTISLPTASRDATQNRLRNMAPNNTMRDFINRANPELVAMARAQPQTQPETNVALRTARDVPAVISSSLRAAGIQSPEWDKIRNLPGMNDDIVRALGSGMMSTMTSTPVGDIKVIANLIGRGPNTVFGPGRRGPNTSAEMNAVSNWLKNNAQDLGDVIPSHGEAAPGYEVEAHNYKINGILFHMVKDHGGDYIYAWPARDTKQPAGVDQGQDNIRVGNGRNTPRLGESTGNIFDSLSLLESLKFDEEIASILREDTELDEVWGKPNAAERRARTVAGHGKRVAARQADAEKAFAAGEELPPEVAPLSPEKSQLSRVVGKRPGGIKLIKHLHATEKLSNEAELEPIPVTTGKDAAQLAWAQFNNNPDDFVIVSGQGGVAGIKPNKASVEKFKATAAKKGKEPNYSKHAGAIRYDVIAYTGEGAKVPTNLLQPAGAAQDDGGDLDDYQDADQGAGEPKVKAIKARMGLVHGQDRQNSDNVFNLLNAQIGPITTVWIAGWAGNRGGDTDTMPASPGAVERGKMKGRADLAAKVGEPEKLAFPDRQTPMPAQADTGTSARALDVIFKKSLTSTRVKKMIGSAIEKLIGAERKAQQNGLRDKAVEIGQRILKLEDIQKMALRGEDYDPATKASFQRAALRIAGNLVDTEQPGLQGQKRDLAVTKYLSSLAKSGSPDLYKPFIRTLMNTLSKEGLRQW